MSTRFLVLCLSLAAIFTMVKYVIQVEGTLKEKLGYFWDTGKRLLTGMQKKYKGGHRYNRKLPTYYGTRLA